MRPTRVRTDQDVLSQVKIILDMWEATTLRPSLVDRDCQTSPPPVLTSPVEDDG